MVRVQFSDMAPAVVARRRHVSQKIMTVAASLMACTAMASTAWAADPVTPADPADPGQEIVVTGSLGALPNKDVGTIFGFNKTLVETPRSASTFSSEQTGRFGVTDI